VSDDEVKGLLNGSGIPWYPFDKVGDEVRGVVVSAKAKDETYMDDGPGYKKGDVKTWPDSKPKRMIVVTVQTDITKINRYDAQTGQYGEELESESGKWVIGLTGNKYTAAARVLGNDIIEGSIFGMKFVQYSDRAPKAQGFSRAKLFEAYYEEAPKGVNIQTGEAPTLASATASAPAGGYATSTPQSGNQGVLIPNGGRPDYLDQSTWDVMSPGEKAELSPPAPSLVKPAAVPQAAWDKMSDDVKRKVLGAASSPV
jgi:hypothetical protein